ncbi:hypothetical protein GIB67_030648 [Kingdonia uniflora]|uniref:HTH myb-type domain-containing protein n=1 Tax=Kingdonia uniflora TaxID=39325 RepID=A0A7J7NID5_9MAGN|nr:hypothetical protein GIB67_030648 [Kingdonia uniflora]
MRSPSEITQDCNPQSYTMLLKSFGNHEQNQSQNLEEFLARLEEEWLKIEAFKRELPLCMQLLSNAMETSRQQLHTQMPNQGPRPVLEEFIPLKNSNSEDSNVEANVSEKASWMVSAQLWSQSDEIGSKQQQTTVSSANETDSSFGVSPKLVLDDKKRNGGAFLPFSKEHNICASPKLCVLSELALASNENEIEDIKFNDINNGMSCSRRDSSNKSTNGGALVEQGKVETQVPTTNTTTTQSNRKARRCWSPDLHKRFVNALQMLGGSQVATPKQIRELMKVDGLTNDEVKSHLQKYRLHTRRPGPNPQVQGTPIAPHLVVFYATAASAHGTNPTLYGAHPTSLAPTHYCAPTVPAEFYTAPHHQLHHTLHHHHMYKAQNTPESDTGERSESIEDGKSESGSWKGDSGGELTLASLRDEGEKSNGNEITLKF